MGSGKTKTLEYASSTELMLAAEAAGKEWTSKAPMPLHVVTSVTDSDNLDLAGRPGGNYVTEYSYRDPVYDGRQREFRGFRQATPGIWVTTIARPHLPRAHFCSVSAATRPCPIKRTFAPRRIAGATTVARH